MCGFSMCFMLFGLLAAPEKVAIWPARAVPERFGGVASDRYNGRLEIPVFLNGYGMA
jgi:hypothetical protein